jgi:elongation factor Ts
MSAITASLVKELREKTNAGMMDCKAALTEANGDLAAAEDILRKKGIAKAGKKADREAKDGLVHAAISADGRTGTMIEVNCETDFVSKNENFRGFVQELSTLLQGTDVADAATFLTTTAGSGLSVEETVKAKIAEIGENIVIKRLARFSAGESSRLASYIHMQGRVGVLLEVAAGKAESLQHPDVKSVVQDITLHICAASPICIGRDEVPAEVVEKEKEIAAEQVKDKPAAAIAKIVEGKMGKFYSQVCLLEQGFIKDPDQTIADLLKTTGAKAGDTLVVKRFQRFAIGEA